MLDNLELVTTFVSFYFPSREWSKPWRKPDSVLFVLLRNFELCLLTTVNSRVWGEIKFDVGSSQPNLYQSKVGGSD